MVDTFFLEEWLLNKSQNASFHPEINYNPSIYLQTTRFKKSKFEPVPGEMIGSEIFVDLVIKIVQARDELKFKKKTVKGNRQATPV